MSSVLSKLDGGINGHLGLGFCDHEYDGITPITYYVCLLHPDVVPGVGPAQHKTLRLQDKRKDGIRLFREVTDVEKIILK